MEHMDNVRERVEALEQQTAQLTQQTQALARQARWWRGMACGMVVLALGGWGLQAGNAVDAVADHVAALQKDMAVLRDTLGYIRSATNDQGYPEVVITGANLRIVNGLGATDCTDAQDNPIPDCPNGLGNLIVGYNEPRGFEDVRTGSHNVVVGQGAQFLQLRGAGGRHSERD